MSDEKNEEGPGERLINEYRNDKRERKYLYSE